jgi:uncharacterized protein YbaP (TraB family)
MIRPLALFLALVLPLALQAQDAPRNENSLLWEISHPDLNKTSYLYGTIHLIGANDFFLTEATKEAFAASEKVVFEINLEDMMNMSGQLSMLMKAFMSGGMTLKKLLSPVDYKLVGDHFNNLGMPLALFERIKPLFLAAMVQGGGGLNPEEMKSYEMEFLDMAKAAKKPMAGLETAEYQMSMFDSIPYKVQATMLVDAIKASGTDSDEMQKMTNMYKSQDIEGMHSSFLDEDSELFGYEELLLNQRNRNWIPVMADMMRSQTVFFAVGAGHLGGPEGVVELLRIEGYTLKPLF